MNENRKLDNIYAYLLKDFKDDICLDEAAEFAHMTSSAFSRYFKKVNRKTPSPVISHSLDAPVSSWIFTIP